MHLKTAPIDTVQYKEVKDSYRDIFCLIIKSYIVYRPPSVSVCVLIQVTFVCLILDSHGGWNEEEEPSRYVGRSNTWVRFWLCFHIKEIKLSGCRLWLMELQQAVMLHCITATAELHLRSAPAGFIWPSYDCDAPVIPFAPLCFVSAVLQSLVFVTPLFIFWVMLIISIFFFLLCLNSSWSFRWGSIQPRCRLVVPWHFVVLTGNRRGEGPWPQHLSALNVILYQLWSLIVLLQFPVPAEPDHSTMFNRVKEFSYVLPVTLSSPLILLLTEVCKCYFLLSNVHTVMPIVRICFNFSLSMQLLSKNPANRLRNLECFKMQSFFHGFSFDSLILQKTSVGVILELRTHPDWADKARRGLSLDYFDNFDCDQILHSPELSPTLANGDLSPTSEQTCEA